MISFHIPRKTQTYLSKSHTAGGGHTDKQLILNVARSIIVKYRKSIIYVPKYKSYLSVGTRYWSEIMSQRSEIMWK